MAIESVPSQKHAVSFDSIKQADQTRQSGIIWRVILDYLNDRPEKNFATVEQKLRVHQCFTRLIAAQAPHPGLTARFRDRTCTYHLFISTGELKESFSQFLRCADDEETNLARLADTGILVPT